MSSIQGSASSQAGSRLRNIDATAVIIWLLTFSTVFYIALEGGGYEPSVRAQAGIIIWWVLLLGAAVGALPIRRPGKLGWFVTASFGAFTAWTAASLIWSESAERTGADLGRIATLLGVLVLAMFVQRTKGTRRMVSAIGTAIAAIALLALLSRLHPEWFSNTLDLAEFFPDQARRLSYPLNYWNGLGIFIAAGVPLVLHLATSGRSVTLRSIAAASMPAMILALYLTYSRTGTVVTVIALIVFFGFTSDRLPRLATAILVAIGSGVLISLTAQQTELANGLVETSAARSQGDQLSILVCLTCLVVGVAQAGLTTSLRKGRPDWTEVSSTTTRQIWAIIAGVLAVGAIVVTASGFVADSWNEFKAPGNSGSTGSERLQSFSGHQRYQLWETALDQNASSPLVGDGSGTYELWHNRNGGSDGFVRDAHSLYLETLGELGIVGFAILVVFMGSILVVGVQAARKAAPRLRPQLAAALAACSAIAVAAAADWVWELAILPIVFMLLAGTLLGSTSRRSENGLPWLARTVVILASVGAIVAIAIPLATTALINQSQREADAGNLSAALTSSRKATSVNPSSASAFIQQALVLEAQGEYNRAITAARKATTLEETNWRPWLVLARMQVLSNVSEAAALRSYRRARSLNPNSPIFN